MPGTGSTIADKHAPGALAKPLGSARRCPREQARAPTSAGHAGEQLALAEVEATFHRLSTCEDAFDHAAVREIHRRRAAVDAAAARSHYTLALLGNDVEQRTRLLNELLGEDLVDPARRDAVGGKVRFRHGASMGYRARFSDGGVEDFAELVPDRSDELGEEVARTRGRFEETEASVAAIEARLEDSRGALDARDGEVAAAEAELERLQRRSAAAARAEKRAAAERTTALETAERRWSAVPGFLRSRPPWWALWAWIARVLVGWRHRQALAEATTLSQRAMLLHSHGDAAQTKTRQIEEKLRACRSRRDMLKAAYDEDARRVAALEEEVVDRRSRMLECRQELERAEARLAAFVDGRRSQFAQRVRALTDARGRAETLESLQVELESLSPDVEVVDVGGADHALDLQRVWELVDREADGCAIAGELPRQAQQLFGGALRSATPDLLVVRLRRARVLRATRHAAEACKVARQSLDAASGRAAEETRRRIEALHKEREAGVRRLESELARVQPEVKGRAASALTQAGNHIEWAIDQLGDRWLGEVRGADTLARLRATLARFEAEAVESLLGAADDARALLMSTLSGIVAELVPALADEHAQEIALPTWSELEVAPFPADLRRAIRVAPSRFGAHLQPLATTRAACEEALQGRLERLRRRAVATLLNLEPQTASQLENALSAIALAIHQARDRRYQKAVGEVRAAAEERAKAGRDELVADIQAFASRLEEHERKLVSGL